MKKIQFKIMFSTIVFASMLMVAVSINAAPVKFKQVVQVVNAKPGKAATANFSKLSVVSDPVNVNTDGDGDDDKKKKTTETVPQDGRVIKTVVAEITEDEDCKCEDVGGIGIERGGFPKWPLFGLGAVPLAFIKTPGDGPTPTPTPPTTGTPTPTTATPTPTTATPTPPPVPEPMTLLLFGTGLAGFGLAARKRFGKKTEGEEETEAAE